MVKSTSQWMRCRFLSYIDSRDSTQEESMQGRANTQGRVRYVFLKWTSIMWDLETADIANSTVSPIPADALTNLTDDICTGEFDAIAPPPYVPARDLREFHIWRPKRSWSWSWINAEAPKTDLNGVGGWSGWSWWASGSVRHHAVARVPDCHNQSAPYFVGVGSEARD
jgi:hypothetical protein